MAGLQPDDLVPMRWPSEPEWTRSEALTILEKSPITCILVAKENAALATAGEKIGIQVVATPAATLISEPVWPGVQRNSRGTTSSDAGPTGVPWVDANGWAVSLARAKNPGKPVWVPAEPPPDRVMRPENFALAIADAEAYGGRWVVSLDGPTKKGLLSGEAQARETWKTITKALSFFREHHAAWADAGPVAKFGVMSDFAGENEFLGKEILNLSARRHLAYRILLPDSSDLTGLAGLLWIGQKAPQDQTLARVRSFVGGGGILVAPVSAASVAAGSKPQGKHETGYQLYASGKGQIAVATDEWSDPYVVATDAHRIIGRRHDAFRLWNAAASNAYPVAKGDRTLGQVMNYTGRTIGHPISLWISRRAKSARFRDLFGRSEALSITERNGGTEVNLPPFSCYAAIEMGEQA
jgi:hypothetical protein